MSRDFTSYVWYVLILMSLSSWAWAGQRDALPPNIGQVDLTEEWRCPVTYPYNPNDGDQLTFTPFPIAVSLTTTGGPVLLSFTMTSGNSAAITLILMVNNSAIADLTWGGYDSAPVTLTRLIAVPAGTHSFGARIACANGGDPYWVTQAWVAAYELPMLAR